MKTLYFISGTMGVGKTYICKALNEKLDQSIFLDGDWCFQASPFVINKETKAIFLNNIVAILNNDLHCSVFKNIIFCWVMDKQSIIDSILSQLNLNEVIVKNISLVCDEKTLINHLKKDIKKNCRNESIISRSLARLESYQSLNTKKIDISNKRLEQVMMEIME